MTIREIEQQVFHRIITEATAHGWELHSIDDGMDEWVCYSPEHAWEEATQLDEATIRFRKPGERGNKWQYAGVFVVFGNSGDDLITDYHTSLDAPMEAVAQWIDNTFQP